MVLQSFVGHIRKKPGFYRAYPTLQSKYTETKTEQNELYISKGARTKSYHTDLDLTVDNLINSISNWT
jgi:hypothetical protein